MSHDTTALDSAPETASHGSAEKALDLDSNAFDDYWQEIDERSPGQPKTSSNRYDPPGYHDDEPVSSRRETPEHDDDAFEDSPAPRSRKQSAKPSEVFSEKPDFSVFGSPFTEPPIEQVKVEEEKPKDEAKPKEEKPAKVTAEKADKDADNADADDEPKKSERKAKAKEIQAEMDSLAELDGVAIPPKVRDTINAKNAENKKLRAEVEAAGSKIKEFEKADEARRAGRYEPPPPAVHQKRIEELERRVQELEPHEQKTKIASHPEFKRNFAEPVNQAFENIINTCCAWGNDCLAAIQDQPHYSEILEKWKTFVNNMRNAGADYFTPEHWKTHVLNKLADDNSDDALTRQKKQAVRTALEQQINGLFQLRQNRDGTLEEYAKNPGSYSRFVQESDHKLKEDRKRGIADELPQMTQEIARFGKNLDPKTLEGLTKEVEPIAIKYFSLIQNDVDGATQGREWAKASIRAAVSEVLHTRNEQKIHALTRENQMLKDELVEAGMYDKGRPKGKDDFSDAKLKKSFKEFGKTKK